VLLFARVMGEKYAGTPLAKYFITSESGSERAPEDLRDEVA
jgi:hypothetical protein